MPHIPPLLTPPPVPRRRTSVVLQELVTGPDAGTTRIRFGDIVEKLGDRAHGLLLILLGTLNIIPMAAVLAGPAIALVGLQMLAGRRQPWLPHRLLALELSARQLDGMLLRLLPWIVRAERYLRPRWPLSEVPVVDRLLGGLICLLGLVAAIPAPFTNVPPSIPVIIIGLGLAERDGLFQLLGTTAGALVLALLSQILLGLLRSLF